MQLTEDLRKILLLKRRILLQGSIDGEKQESVSNSILYLNALDNKTTIDLFIDSAGGKVNMAGYLRDTIRLSESPIHGIVVGVCHSAAFDILQTCHRRIAYTNSHLIFHWTRLNEFEVVSDRKKMMTLLDQIHVKDVELLKRLAKRSGQPLKQLKKWADEGKKFSAVEALKCKFIDEIR